MDVEKSIIKRKRVSKKTKKSWRKHSDIRDVENFLDDVRLQERTGIVCCVDDGLASESSCYSNIEVAFMRNTTAGDVLSVWKASSGSGHRILAVNRNRKNYMALGCVVTGPAVSLSSRLDTLTQLVNYTSLYHKLHTVIVVVILSDIDQSTADDLVTAIVSKYLYEVNLGFIHLVQQQRSNGGEGGAQIQAMSVIGLYVGQLASHYLHLGTAPVSVASDYVESIRDFVQRETRRRRRITTWTLLEFSSPNRDDFLGYFMHAGDVDRFARFFRDFGSVRGAVDQNHTQALHSIFLDIVTQKSSLLRRPAIFRRTDSPDEDFAEDDLKKPWPSADDPPATIISSMLPAGKHSIDLAYSTGGGYFQSSSAASGDWIAIIFEMEVIIDRICVSTGLPDGSLVLKSGFVEASPRLLKLDVTVPNVVCADFVRVGEIAGRSTELIGVERVVWGRPTRCLRITVGELGEGGSEVVFHQIAVFT